MAFQLINVVDATKKGPAALLDLGTAGVAWDETAYTEGLEFANDGKTFLFIKNLTSGVDIQPGWIPVDDPDGRQAPDDALTEEVLDDDEGIMGPFLPRIWNSALGRIQFKPNNVAHEATITYVAIRIDNPT